MPSVSELINDHLIDFVLEIGCHFGYFQAGLALSGVVYSSRLARYIGVSKRADVWANYKPRDS